MNAPRTNHLGQLRKLEVHCRQKALQAKVAEHKAHPKERLTKQLIHKQSTSNPQPEAKKQALQHQRSLASHIARFDSTLITKHRDIRLAF